MTALLVVEGLVSCFVLAWMMYLLVRAPRNVPLRAVTVTIASFVLMFVVRSSVADGSGFLGLEPIIARLVLHFTNILGGYGLIVFFLFSALDLRTARRRAMWQAVPVVLAAGIMTWAVAAMPARVRAGAAALTTGRPGASPHAEITVALLYLTMYVYMVYAFTTALVWTWRYARGAEPRLRRGLALAAVGLAAIVPSEVVFSLTQIVRWAGGTMPREPVVIAIPLFLGGVVVFLIGFAYPAVVMRLAAIRVWWQHRRTYHQLGPLWTMLHQEFPQDALNRVPTGQWRNRLRLLEVHRRYYRRVIECRDGLVRVSPYLADGDNPLAERLRDGLRAHASGAAVGARATPVAIPHTDGLDADVRELVALSDALHASK